MNYCNFANNLPEGSDNPSRRYRAERCGFPIEDDDGLFGQLVLEVNQAGLSWDLTLRRQQAFQTAYKGFNIDTVAAFSDTGRERLLADAGVVRNRLRVNAAIYNAQQIRRIRQECDLFKNWLDMHHPRTKEEWMVLSKKRFKLMGGEIVGEFLMDTGYLLGAHAEDCRVCREVLKYRPKWVEAAPADFMRE